ncbi:hypothetical protein BDN72DRAFT_894570 [Pluteus cervinus]|uniref:Uncharacterized protein n=1 Tax=Pluteus cervinus TaxID=181527 RepID=A0ACD3B3W6_9AGAR|nr:hypothetical protein BDN72DRAFT_894570 [Pluteus cervinus]
MMMASLWSVLVTGWLAGTLAVHAAVSYRYNPVFNPQSISTDIIELWPDERTTWQLRPAATGPLPLLDFPGTATLIQGSNFGSLTYGDPGASFTIGYICPMSRGFAICTVAVSGETTVQTELVSNVPIQGSFTLQPITPLSLPSSFPSSLPPIPSNSSLAGTPIPTSSNAGPAITLLPSDSELSPPLKPSQTQTSPNSASRLIACCGSWCYCFLLIAVIIANASDFSLGQSLLIRVLF